MGFNSGIRISLRCKAHTQKNIRIGAPLSLYDLVQNDSVQVVIHTPTRHGIVIFFVLLLLLNLIRLKTVELV